MDRLVHRVQWMEILDDFADFLMPGDLLLTTGYNLARDVDLREGVDRAMPAGSPRWSSSVATTCTRRLPR